jgi:hypothetical protein
MMELLEGRAVSGTEALHIDDSRRDFVYAALQHGSQYRGFP